MPRVLLLLALCSLTVAAQDRIDLFKGSPITGVKITKETFRRVSYDRASGTSASVDASLVSAVSRGDTPIALREGRALFLIGDHANAVRVLETAARAADAEDWVKEHASFWRAKALLASGQANQAASAFGRVLQVNAESRLLPEVRIGRAEALAADGNFGEAKSVLESFATEVGDKKLPRRWAIEAKRGLGRVLEAQGKWSDAAREYDSLLRDASSAVAAAPAEEKSGLLRAALKAELDRGNALIRADRVNEAMRAFAGVRGKYAGTPGVNAVAVMGEGQVALAKGDPDTARIKFAEVLALHFLEPTIRPRAMLLSAESYMALAKAGEREARDKASVYLKTIMKRYAGSDEARQAQELTNKL